MFMYISHDLHTSVFFSLICTQLIVVTGVLAENALEHENIRRIQDLIEWCVCYFREKNVDAWVDAKGGWVSKP